MPRAAVHVRPRRPARRARAALARRGGQAGAVTASQGATGRPPAAIDLCAASRCARELTAGLRRDRGIVLANANRVADAERDLDAAIALDPRMTISQDFLGNATLAAIWARVRERAATHRAVR
jgi:hypothetical protein